MFLRTPLQYTHIPTPLAIPGTKQRLPLGAAHVEMAPPSVPPSWPTEAPDQLPLPSLEQSGMELQRNNDSFKYCQDTCYLEGYVGFTRNPGNQPLVPENWYLELSTWKLILGRLPASFRMPYLFRCELLVSRRSVFFCWMYGVPFLLQVGLNFSRVIFAMGCHLRWKFVGCKNWQFGWGSQWTWRKNGTKSETIYNFF